jgi:hypothetical protein
MDINDTSTTGTETSQTAADISTPKPKGWRALLKVHPAADDMPPMTAEEFEKLVEDIRWHGVLQPVTLYHDPNLGMCLLDGRHRLDALERFGREAVAPDDGYPNCEFIEIESTKLFDPVAYVISANLHRRHLTAEQRRNLITKLLKADPSRSDRQIAETVKVSPTTVGKVRNDMEVKGDVSKLDTRRDTKGRQQPAHRQIGVAIGPERVILIPSETEQAGACCETESAEAKAAVEAKAAATATEGLGTNSHPSESLFSCQAYARCLAIQSRLQRLRPEQARR